MSIKPKLARIREKCREMLSSKGARAVLALAAVAAIIALLISTGLRSENSATIENVNLSKIKTYLSKSNADPDKSAQDQFSVGDPIQVGFKYDSGDSESENESKDALVKFVVYDTSSESADEVFTTNLFKLEPGQDELFVSINNTSLPASSYRVELQNQDDTTAESLNFTISD